MKIVKLGELVMITIGRTPSRGEPRYWDTVKEKNNIWLSIADLLQADGRIVSDSKEYITDVAASTFKIVPKGTLLVSFKLTLGRLAYAGKELRTNEAIAALHNDESRVINDYLYYYLSHFSWMDYAASDKKVKGFTLNKAKLHEIPIKYPESLEEQRRVVERLDAAFEKIDRAIELTEKNVHHIHSLRAQAIESSMSSLPSNNTKLGAFCEFENGDRGKNYPSKSKQIKSGVPFINAGNLGRSKIDFDNMAYISEDTFNKLGNGKIKANDILFCLRGSLGKFAAVGELDKGAIASSLVIVRPDRKLALVDYLLYYFEGSKCGQMIRKFENGAAQPNLSAGSLKKFEIKLPSVEDQRTIVKKLNDNTNSISTIMKLYTKRLNHLYALKQSLLTQAFTQGEVE